MCVLAQHSSLSRAVRVRPLRSHTIAAVLGMRRQERYAASLRRPLCMLDVAAGACLRRSGGKVLVGSGGAARPGAWPQLSERESARALAACVLHPARGGGRIGWLTAAPCSDLPDASDHGVSGGNTPVRRWAQAGAVGCAAIAAEWNAKEGIGKQNGQEGEEGTHAQRSARSGCLASSPWFEHECTADTQMHTTPCTVYRVPA